MTKEQREKTKLALRRYGTRQWACSPANVGWRQDFPIYAQSWPPDYLPVIDG